MKNLFTLLVFLLVATATEVSAQSFKVIVNESNSTDAISQSELSDVFLKSKTTWDDGTSIQPIDLSANSAVREAFSQENPRARSWCHS